MSKSSLTTRIFLMLIICLIIPTNTFCIEPPKQFGEGEPFFETIKTQKDMYTLHLLTEFVPVLWDKALVFTSYISAKKIYEKVGYKWRGGILSHDYEFCYTMVFMLADRVVYDVQGPGIGVGFYNIKAELELDNEALILPYPNAFFVVVPKEIALLIKQKPARMKTAKQYGKWEIDTVQEGTFGEMVLTKEGVIFIDVIIKPGYLTNVWALYKEEELPIGEDIPVVVYTNQAELEFDDVIIQFVESNDDNIIVALSLTFQGENKQYRFPFKKPAN